MDISFQPKSTMPEQVQSGPSLKEIVTGIGGLYVGENKSIITIGLTSMLVLVLLGLGGMSMVISSLSSKEADIAQQLTAQDLQVAKLPTQEIKKLSDRLELINQIVKGQPFPTTFLKALEYVVEDDAIFQRAAISYTQSTDSYSLDVDVTVPSYQSVINQREAFKQAPYNQFFTDVGLRNIAVDKSGRIGFKLTGKVAIRGALPEKAEATLSTGTNGGIVTPPTTIQASSTPVDTTTKP